MNLESSTMTKVQRRLVPLIVICYLIAYLDRVNVSFAALEMNRDLGFSATVYGTGAGIFFVAYLCCEIPSNLMMHRYGASRWIARIMLTWGVCAVGMAFIQGRNSFYLGRALLGAAEAGLNPGMLFYFTLWFPLRYRARVTAFLFASAPLSFVIGAPLSGILLGMNGVMNLAGWQWMFIIEGMPAVLLAAYVFFRMTDNPLHAAWLERRERQWLDQALATERLPLRDGVDRKFLSALTDPRVLGMGVVYFASVALNNAISFFLPQIVKSFGMTNLETGFVSAIPGLAAVIATLLWGYHSDRTGERRWHATVALLMGGIALVVSAIASDPVSRVAALTLAYVGCYAFFAPFWTLPGSFLSGAAAAGGLAAISSIGIAGGAAAPWLIGVLKDATGSFAAGQIAIGVLVVVSAVGFAVATRKHLGSSDEAVKVMEMHRANDKT